MEEQNLNIDMDRIRNLLDTMFDNQRDTFFQMTQDDPERAHELFVKWSQRFYEIGTSCLIQTQKRNDIIVSNAAGFNKNGDIPLKFLQCLGFDRVVIGTVTHDEWQGNQRPRIARYNETDSVVNWMGLPGIGSSRVALNVEKYLGNSTLPLTVNIMATPQKTGDEMLRDLEETINDMKGLEYVDRFELNVSCPNTHSLNGQIDSRDEVLKGIEGLIEHCKSQIGDKELYVKVSPDLGDTQILELLGIFLDKGVIGITGVNTTTQYDNNYLSPMPNKGGASGLALQKLSRNSLRKWTSFNSIGNLGMRYISVGGINSANEAACRIQEGAHEIQLYTGLIFKGPRLLTDIRNYQE